MARYVHKNIIISVFPLCLTGSIMSCKLSTYVTVIELCYRVMFMYNCFAFSERDTPSPQFKGFSDMILQHEAALLSLSPQHLEMLMDYVDVLRRQRMNNHRQLVTKYLQEDDSDDMLYLDFIRKIL